MYTSGSKVLEKQTRTFHSPIHICRCATPLAALLPQPEVDELPKRLDLRDDRHGRKSTRRVFLKRGRRLTLRSASAARHEDATMSTKFAEVAPRAGRGRGRGRGRRNHQEQQQKLFQEKVVASIPACLLYTSPSPRD